VSADFIIEESGIYHGDADLLLPRIRPESVNLIITDPPYNVTRENNFDTMGRAGIEYEWDGDFDQMAWLPVAVERLVLGGSMIIWNDWKNLGDIARALEVLGMEIKDTIVWSKTNPMPRNTDRRYVPCREHGFWAVKVHKKHPWVFNKRSDNSYERGEFHYPVQHSIHPAKKPDGLFQELIEIHTNPGDLVVDPYAGVATTACAAQPIGRRHISFEIRQDFFEEGVRRFQEETGAKLVKRVEPDVVAHKPKKQEGA